jgi:hypothetical protein
MRLQHAIGLTTVAVLAATAASAAEHIQQLVERALTDTRPLISGQVTRSAIC